MMFVWIKKFVISVVVLVVAFMLYNVDAIIGKWKFKRMCKEEGGPRFYAPVEKDMGWEVEGEAANFEWPFSFGHIGFVRFKDKNGLMLDAYAGGVCLFGCEILFPGG